MRRFFLAAAGAMIALAACSRGEQAAAPAADPEAAIEEALANDDEAGAQSDATISGTANWDAITLPETARLIVEVNDITRPPEGGDLLMREEFPLTDAPPAAFSGTVSKFDLIPGGNLVLSARVQDGYAILLATDGSVDIADFGETAGVELFLFSSEDLANGLPREMITPQGTAYTCGGEPVTIALEAGAAYVTFSDGKSMKLPKLDGAAGGAVQFSTGRFVVEQQGEAIRFGRGRAMPMACQPAP